MSKNNDKQPTIRCAIYTPKSTDEGLEQDFNSLDAQREAGEAYIASQKSEGWVCLPDHYDDGGFTGGLAESLSRTYVSLSPVAFGQGVPCAFLEDGTLNDLHQFDVKN
jgi:hypothetical protein